MAARLSRNSSDGCGLLKERVQDCSTKDIPGDSFAQRDRR